MNKRNFIILIVTQITIIIVASYFLVIYLPIVNASRNMKDIHEIELSKIPQKFAKYDLTSRDDEFLKNMITVLDADNDISLILTHYVKNILYFLIGLLIVSLGQCIYLGLLFYKHYIGKDSLRV